MQMIRKNIKWITLIVLTFLIISAIVTKYYLENQKVKKLNTNEFETAEEIKVSSNSVEPTNEELTELKPTTFYVDIKGAIKKPGVYEATEGKKVIDIINQAGGTTKDADTSLINLSKKVYDEMVIIVYTKTEVKNSNKKETVIKVVEKECNCPEIKNDACINQNKNEITEETKDDKKININKATLEELLTLTGIGESKAQAIIEYREKNGDYQKIEDLLNVSGIGESVYEKIKNNITI